MKYDPQLYRADVKVKTDKEYRLHQLVLAYNLDHARTMVAYEFFGQVWSGPALPCVGKGSFAQQLHQFAYAVHTFHGPRAEDFDQIRGQLVATYGPDIEALINTVPPIWPG